MTLPISPEIIALASVIVFAGTVLQGSIGFGLGSLAVPLLLLIHPAFVPGPTLAIAFVLTVLLFSREHGAVRKPDLGWAIGGRVIGTVVAIQILRVVSQTSLEVLVCVIVLVSIALMWGGLQIPLTNKTLLTAGSVSGFMATSASIGGPPIAMVYAREEGARIRGTLSGIFMAGTVISLIGLASIGRFGWHEIQLALLMIPAILVGFVASRFSATLLDRGFIRPVIYVVSAGAASLVILRSLL